ncbi:hypothetical protein RBB78_20925 [Tunturiibacter empetritectus]
MSVFEALEEIDDAPADQTKVARIDRNLLFAESIDQTIEDDSLQIEKPGLLPFDADAIDDIGSLLPLLQKCRDQLGRILEVNVKLNRCVATRACVTCHDRALESEVSRESIGMDPAISRGEIPQQGKGLIGAVIVGEDKFEPV